jgi:hypothetical protein
MLCFAHWLRTGEISRRSSIADCGRERHERAVADDPAVIVDTADGVLRVARLDVEEESAAGRQRAPSREDEQRAVAAEFDSGAAAGGMSGAFADANTRPWPGSSIAHRARRRAAGRAAIGRRGGVGARDTGDAPEPRELRLDRLRRTSSLPRR